MSEPTVFATLRRSRRIWAVASIHGEATRLAALHDALAQRLHQGDRIVYLGNYLGRGPGVRSTFDQLIDFRRWVIAQPGMFAADVVFLRGCQEEMWQKLLQLQFATDPTGILKWTLNQGVGATLESYGGHAEEGLSVARQGAVAITKWTQKLRQTMNATPGHADLMAALMRAAFTDDGKLLFVSAGVDPSLPLTAQVDSLWWGSAGFSALEGPVSLPYAGYARVIRGFARERVGKALGACITSGRYTTTVDGGAGFGGKLAAACFDPRGQMVDVIEV
jgi:serine/threonine protein phosphatase 1